MLVFVDLGNRPLFKHRNEIHHHFTKQTETSYTCRMTNINLRYSSNHDCHTWLLTLVEIQKYYSLVPSTSTVEEVVVDCPNAKNPRTDCTFNANPTTLSSLLQKCTMQMNDSLNGHVVVQQQEHDDDGHGSSSTSSRVSTTIHSTLHGLFLPGLRTCGSPTTTNTRQEHSNVLTNLNLSNEDIQYILLPTIGHICIYMRDQYDLHEKHPSFSSDSQDYKQNSRRRQHDNELWLIPFLEFLHTIYCYLSQEHVFVLFDISTMTIPSRQGEQDLQSCGVQINNVLQLVLYMLQARLQFLKESSMHHESKEHSKSKLFQDAIVYLCFSLLTRILLTMEYIHTIADEADSLPLFLFLRPACHTYKMYMNQVMAYAIQVMIHVSTDMSHISSVQSKTSKSDFQDWICLTAMSFLGTLRRIKCDHDNLSLDVWLQDITSTSINSSQDLLESLVERFQKILLRAEFLEKDRGGDSISISAEATAAIDDNDTTLYRTAYLRLAYSFVLLYSPYISHSDSTMEKNHPLVIRRIVQHVFTWNHDKNPQMKHDMFHKFMDAHLLIHFAICKKDALLYEIQSEKFRSMTKDVIIQWMNMDVAPSRFILSSSNMILIVWIRLHNSFRFHFRYLLTQVLTDDHFDIRMHMGTVLNHLLSMTTGHEIHVTTVTLFLRMILNNNIRLNPLIPRHRDSLATLISKSMHEQLLADQSPVLQRLKALSIDSLDDKDVYRPSTWSVLQMSFEMASDAQMCKILCDQILGNDGILSLIEIFNIELSTLNEYNRLLKCQAALTAATIIGLILFHDVESGTDTNTLRLSLMRFVSNIPYKGNNDMEGRSSSLKSMGIFQYALSQSYVRNITRKAVIFQSIMIHIQEEHDGFFDFANVIFETAFEKSKTEMIISERNEYHAKEMNAITMKYNNLKNQNLLLQKEMEHKETLHRRNLFQSQRESDIQTVELSHVHNVERSKMIHEMNQLENQLSECKALLHNVSSELDVKKISMIQQQNDLENYQNRVMSLEKSIEDHSQLVQSLQQQLSEKTLHLANAHENIRDLSYKLQKQESIELELHDTNQGIKQRLEESLIQVISLVQIYNHKEKDHKNEIGILNEKLDHQLVLKQKYSLLKEKYQETKSTLEKERQMHQLQVQKKERKERDDRTSNKSNGTIRKPMGTLAFMNSLHDTSFKIDSSRSSKNMGEKSNMDKNKFRIMK